MKIKYLPIFFTLFSAKFSFAASDSLNPCNIIFSFNGIFGTIDKKSAQRGLQVYIEFVLLVMD